jgi:hypothetical protein
VLSNRADLISGGDALVAARLAPGTDAAAVRVTLNGSDITSNFAVRENGQYQGLVTGLVEGENLLRARLPDGSGHEITIKNHPIGGPVFSGEQIQPWLCRTQLQGGTTPALGASVDEKCNAAAPIVELFYRSTGNQWVAYTPTTLPELIQPTTTDEGKTVPFIIQRVTGTANRGIYQIAVLVDPTKPIAPWSTGQPWNLKYVNTFGGACSVNYQQPTVGDVRSVARLGLGFAVGTSSLNTYGNQCSDVISAEALMMTKEIIVERWGPIRYTIGDGGSAGTMQQHMISGAYPGLLNGLMTSLLYEDHWFQVVDSFDCLVLSRYFGLGGGGPFGPNPRLGRRWQCALQHARLAAARLWHQPVRSGRQVLAEDRLHRRRADCRQPVGMLRPAEHAALALGPGQQSERHALHDPGLHQVRLRGRARQQGAASDRQRRPAVRPRFPAEGDAHAGQVRRFELAHRRHGHRRRLAAAAHRSRPRRPHGALPHRPHHGRLGSGVRRRDRRAHQPHRRGLSSAVPFLELARADRSYARQPRQQRDLGVQGRRGA